MCEGKEEKQIKSDDVKSATETKMIQYSISAAERACLCEFLQPVINNA